MDRPQALSRSILAMLGSSTLSRKGEGKEEQRDLIDASRRIADMNAAATVPRVCGVTDMPRAG